MFGYLDGRHADPALVAKIRGHESRRFCNQVPFLEYLASKGIDIFDRQAVRVIAEAGVWGSIRHHGLLGDTVIVSLTMPASAGSATIPCVGCTPSGCCRS
uniref:hypothetical protein n=1 Tax=Ensifer sesbaniae TaxID=1214071 RepID=UPI001FECD1E6|nr:hypothetical protein [Ensifer sesbaniae]